MGVLHSGVHAAKLPARMLQNGGRQRGHMASSMRLLRWEPIICPSWLGFTMSRFEIPEQELDGNAIAVGNNGAAFTRLRRGVFFEERAARITVNATQRSSESFRRPPHKSVARQGRRRLQLARFSKENKRRSSSPAVTRHRNLNDINVAQLFRTRRSPPLENLRTSTLESAWCI